MTIRFKIQFNVMKLNFISSAQWYEILSEIAGFFFKFGPRGRSRDPLPPEWTSEDFLLTPLPSLLVHVVVEWPLRHTQLNVKEELPCFLYLWVLEIRYVFKKN